MSAEALEGPFREERAHAYCESGDDQAEQEDDQTIAKP